MYADLPSFPPSSSFLLAVLFARCRQMSTWTSRVQWAMPDLNRELQRPGSSKADWAMPDLNRGAPKRTGQRRTSPGDLPSGVGSAGPQLPEDMSEDVSEICQKRMSENVRRYIEMPEEMSKDMSEDMSEKNVRKNARRYLRRNIRRY